MSLNVGKEVAAMQRMNVKELRQRYAEVFGDGTRTGNKAWLMKRIVWRLQAIAEGGLSERVRQRAEELANEADIRMTPPKAELADSKPNARTVATAVRFSDDNRIPLPGTVLMREYKGQTLQVRVLENGFEYEGEVYRSLSGIAKAIPGSHTNGFLFFRLRKGCKR